MRIDLLNNVIKTCKSECKGNAIVFDFMYRDFLSQCKLTHEEFLYINKLAQSELSLLK